VWKGRDKTGQYKGLKNMISKLRFLALALGWLASMPVAGQEEDETGSRNDPVNLNFVGDDVRIGIGYDSETDLTGEFFWSFSEQPDSSWIAEGWIGDGSSGGLKINYHWLANGVEAGQDINGKTVFGDGRVRKLFIATDRNIFDDSKVTFGGGGEYKDGFWSLYGSRSTSGERFLRRTVDVEDLFFTGLVDNHVFTRTDVLETTTDFFAHPYDWGVGFRMGRYFDNALIRVRGGLDYESGDFDSSQATAFAGIDKRFRNSGHGLSLRAEVLRKHGEFEVDSSDVRVGAFWTWDFGSNFQPASVYRDVQVERIPDPSELPREQVVEVVKNQVTMDDTASFSLDSDSLSEAARSALEGFVSSLRDTRILGEIRIVGHTCSLGTDEYNQGLSERRAGTVFDFLVGAGVDASMLRREGRGESEPRFSNETEESRSRNRRVEISFTAEQEVVREVIVGEGQPITEWVQEKVPVEAAWIRRALRNPVAHKRSVDFYRINRVSERYTTGETFVQNTGPSATDDVYSIDQDSGDHVLNVLVNDSDPEGDTIMIASVGSPSNGTAVISGNTITYTPGEGFFGSDSFSYTVEDGYGGTDTAQVTITVLFVNKQPVAEDDEFTVLEDSSNNSFDVLSNDSDPDGDDLTILSVTAGMHGNASISGSSVLYTPNPAYFGTDSFSYTIGDGNGAEATAQVTVTIEEVNNPPIAVDDTATTKEDTPVAIDVLTNDSEPDGDELTILSVSAPMNGTASISGNSILYTPGPAYFGTDSFSYTIGDGKGAEASAQVMVVIEEVNASPVAVDDSATTKKNTSVVIDVLANDFDPDGDPIMIVEIIQDEHPMGFVVDNGDGTLTYTPMTGWWGGDAFQYRISDGRGGTDVATVSLMVTSIFTPPGQ
jgi:outer membrane protein OmpA-like peptidoglycan-associated protein